MTLRLEDVRAAPGGSEVLHGVDLEVADGTCTAVLGPSGAGKTTLLRVVAGLEAPTAGTVHLDGQDLTDVAPEARGLAVVFQDARLFPSMDVLANVAFPLRMAGVEPVAQQRQAEAVLTEVGLDGFGTRHVRTLSGGEAQRVALARALVVRPRALLLDEPFAAVDPERRDDLRSLVARLRRERALTTLLVTHDRDDAALLGDHVAVLLDGAVAQHGTVRSVFDRPASLAVARFVGCDVLLPTEQGVLATRPERVVLDSGPHRGEVVEVVEATDHARVRMRSQGIDLVARVPVGHAPAEGGTIAFDLPDAVLLDDETTANPSSERPT